ncbi:hypothetical protein FIV42_06385 [Persicimonas caeni]|uniref:YtkA-like domain-containing protein n=1 Tax=Persicimonas caeni TaxID=2292766 RepID=A0A4Y6PQ83_PERCE|nr:hypothetical protein [Persicimonas caeni]QDG50373.1 hypothetical protein FIV42_06385 [Persicimonas caeni]QED31594.1 hypothetical protein FRD00_06380 [Persicimonas caeni]
MKKQLTILCLLLVALATACEKQDAEQAEQPADEATEAAEKTAEAEGDEKAEPAEEQEEGASQTDIPADQTMKGKTEGGNFYVVVTPKPNPIPFQELFELDVKVYETEKAEKLVEGVELDQVRATMPAHKHGMKTEPKVAKNEDGSFTVTGMKFHMQGEGEHGYWLVETVLNKDGTIDQAKFDVQCCRE